MRNRSLTDREAGGITILVALMLLVLITITSISMSKNALREAIITGVSRQGSQVRNIADAGLEWSIYWMTDDPNGLRPAPGNTTGAYAVQSTKSTLVKAQQTGMTTGAITNDDMTLSASGVTPKQRFELFMTYMGNPRLKYTQADPHASSITAASPATVQLWSIRSDGYIDYGTSGPTFLHRREAWFTIPPSAVQ